MSDNMKQFAKKEEGFVLVSVMGVLLIILLLLSGILNYDMNQYKEAKNIEERTKAEYIALSAADAVSAYILNGNDFSSLLGEKFLSNNYF